MIAFIIKHRRREGLYIGREGKHPMMRDFPLFMAKRKHADDLLAVFSTALIAEDWKVVEVCITESPCQDIT